MFDRIARVFKSWIGYFISFAEDPEVMLQESIEEMNNTLPKLNQILVNPAGVGPDNPASITGGEDTMSSTAMESFTQNSDAFPNCFTCHDTRTATAKAFAAEVHRSERRQL